MSIDATRWAWEQKLKPVPKLVLLSLADRANEVHECFPSLPRLITDTGADRKTIMASIKKLEQLGLVSVQKSLGMSNYYRLIGVKDRHQKTPSAGQSTSTKIGTTPPVPKEALVPKEVLVPKTGHNQSQKRDFNQSQKRDSNLPINLPITVYAADAEKTDDAKAEKKPTKKRKGSRLEDETGNTLPQSFIHFVESEYPTLDTMAIWVVFRDYWAGRVGKDGEKADWLATWRNWVRNDVKRGLAPLKKTAQQPHLDGVWGKTL